MNITSKNIAAKIILLSAITSFAAEPLSVTTKSGVSAILYSFASLNAAYEDSKSNNGNLANYVNQSDITNENDGGWYLTPNLTRIGFNLSSGSDSTYLKANGKIEIDFYGGGSANNPNPRLRHGYGELSFGKTGFSILGGQTSDVISCEISLLTPRGKELVSSPSCRGYFIPFSVTPVTLLSRAKREKIPSKFSGNMTFSLLSTLTSVVFPTR